MQCAEYNIMSTMMSSSNNNYSVCGEWLSFKTNAIYRVIKYYSSSSFRVAAARHFHVSAQMVTEYRKINYSVGKNNNIYTECIVIYYTTVSSKTDRPSALAAGHVLFCG